MSWAACPLGQSPTNLFVYIYVYDKLIYPPLFSEIATPLYEISTPIYFFGLNNHPHNRQKCPAGSLKNNIHFIDKKMNIDYNICNKKKKNMEKPFIQIDREIITKIPNTTEAVILSYIIYEQACSFKNNSKIRKITGTEIASKFCISKTTVSRVKAKLYKKTYL